MKASALVLHGTILFEPTLIEDSRGAFFESFSHKFVEDAIGHSVTFVQDNHSISRKGVLRGMHFQHGPFAQGKLVRVVRGAAFDVAVDLRPHSPSYGRWTSVTLSAQNRLQLWIPEGFAHGFLALEEGTELLYKTTAYYNREYEGVVNWQAFDVPWPLTSPPILSERDAKASLQFNGVFGK